MLVIVFIEVMSVSDLVSMVEVVRVWLSFW